MSGTLPVFDDYSDESIIICPGKGDTDSDVGNFFNFIKDVVDAANKRFNTDFTVDTFIDGVVPCHHQFALYNEMGRKIPVTGLTGRFRLKCNKCNQSADFDPVNQVAP